MKTLITALFLMFSCDAIWAQQNACDLISDQQLADMHIARSDLSAVNLTTPKELYGTKADLPRSDCRYVQHNKHDELLLPLVSVSTVPNPEGEMLIRTSMNELYQGMQQGMTPSTDTPSLIYSSTPIDGGWCNQSESKLTKPMAGCSAVRKGRLLTVNFINEGPREDMAVVSAKARKYFEAIFDAMR